MPMEQREQLDRLTDKELFMELIKDVAQELDVDFLSHKILVNVCHLEAPSDLAAS